MKRLFGSKKEVPPPPSLTDASSGIGGRVDALDEKIKKLDAELRVHKEKLKTAKGGAKKLATKRAMSCLQKKRMYEKQVGKRREERSETSSEYEPSDELTERVCGVAVRGAE